MIAKNMKKGLSVALTLVLIVFSSRVLNGAQPPATTTAADSGSPTESASQTASELQALVAPIALYPDSLVAQILTASTFPDEVAIANYWIGENKSLTGSALMQAVDKQSWDPSVKALTEFPSVLENMAKNLTWTSSLGEAYHNQQADVMTAIQTLRAEAKAKGNLKTTSQIKVVQQSPQVIVIQPANPQIVYVPQYNPAVIYGYALRGSRICGSRVHDGRRCCGGPHWIRCRNRGGRNDERWVLQLGLQQLELWLARHCCCVPRRWVLRKFRLARRLL